MEGKEAARKENVCDKTFWFFVVVLGQNPEPGQRFCYRVASSPRHSSVQGGDQNDCKQRPLQTLPDVLSWDFSLSGGGADLLIFLFFSGFVKSVPVLREGRP